MRYGTYNWLNLSTVTTNESKPEKLKLAEERKQCLSTVREDSGEPATVFGNAGTAGAMFGETKTKRIDHLGESESSTGTLRSCPSSPFVELRYTLPSDVDIISPFVDQLMRFISMFRRTDKNNFEIELAVREAIANAIVHGNQQDPNKRVYVWCRCAADGDVSATVQDEGEGFDIETVPDPTASENLFRGSGRGVYLMRTLMDEVRFEQRGTVVHLRKRSIARSDTERETR
jgi:serine/threonine-protein kinase RsbW